jgi:hypothetical protein
MFGLMCKISDRPKIHYRHRNRSTRFVLRGVATQHLGARARNRNRITHKQ